MMWEVGHQWKSACNDEGGSKTPCVETLSGVSERPLLEADLMAKAQDYADFAATPFSEARVQMLIRTVGRLQEVAFLTEVVSLLV
jgi:hypothetical protein